MDLVYWFVDFFLHLDKHLAEVIAAYGTYTYGLLFAIVFLETGLVVTPDRGVRVVSGLLTGFHEPRASHLDLLAAVVSKWSGTRAHLATSRPAFRALLTRIEDDPRVAAVFARHWPPAMPA